MHTDPDGQLKSMGVTDEQIEMYKTASSLKNDPNGALKVLNLSPE